MIRGVAIVAMVGLCSSCFSFVYSNTPESAREWDPYEERATYDCTGYVWPVLDTVWMGMNTLSLYTIGNTDKEEWRAKNPWVSQDTAAYSAYLWLLVSGSSALYGYFSTAKCENAREEAERIPRTKRRRAPQTGAPLRWTPSPSPVIPPAPAPATE